LRSDLRRGRDLQVEDAYVLAEPQFDEGSRFFLDGPDRLVLLVLVPLLGRQLGEAPCRFLVHEVAGLVQSDLDDDTRLVDGPLHGLTGLVGGAVQELAAGEILGDLPDPIQDLPDGLLHALGYLSYLAGSLPHGPRDPTSRSASGVPRSSRGPFGFPRGRLLRLPGRLAHRVLRPDITSRPVERFLDLRVGADHILDPRLCVALRELLRQIL
jgi:hypothetical protein